MTITPMGYLFFGSAFAGVLLTVGVRRRFTKTGKPFGVFTAFYIGAILVTMTTLLGMFSVIGTMSVHSMITSPKYEATIIGFTSAWEDSSYTDDDGFTRTERVLMHTAQLRFRDASGRIVEQDSNIRSGAEPTVGDTVTVAYREGGSLQVISLASVGLYVGLALMLLLLAYILTSVLFYTMGRKSALLDRLGGILLVYILIGGGMLFMLAAMIYGVFSYFQPDSDMPLWAMLVCAFFSITLALAFYGMFFVKKDAK